MDNGQHHPTAVITGAASGMGRSTVTALVKQGWDVLALDRDVVEYSVAGETVRTVQADVTRRDEVQRALTDFLGQRPLDLVANVAGIYPPSTLDDFTEELYRRVFDVNVLGVLNVTAESVAHMRDGGSIINFASVDAFTVSPGQLLYGASKAAVVMLTKELALELAPRGIRVNAIAPGWVNTPGNAATGRMAAAAASIPLGRVAEPDEIARWVLLLGSADAAFMTGETVVLSGGDVIR
ncbi:short-chain dehydrogenase [Mycobacterium sp. 852013-50091_SCH5140682]|uniref:SDR family NAD(P)-dependent oxidoreductase n=1 Tax=Mycobacterium sp. 852013-50091_SCH5140682 TaxID=1834109 RepID=UPI0007EB365A|nr:SDR family oxidoreductase [Mycobacterium sp. 852013-50091_SCH5140682]OBC14916.1 short-chain dehydrogenase [Mycobacterium sp. 852013-50091_SCH5140682]